MWYECENGNDIRPADIDTTSSRAYVYVRRNIERVEATDDDEPMPAHYRWEETKIPRDAWVILEQTMAQKDELDTLTSVLYTMMGVYENG